MTTLDLAVMERRCREDLFPSGVRFVSVTDLSEIHMTTAALRQEGAAIAARLAAFTRELEIASILIIGNPLAYAFVTTVRLITPPAVSEYFVATHGEAADLAGRCLREEGITPSDATRAALDRLRTARRRSARRDAWDGRGSTFA